MAANSASSTPDSTRIVASGIRAASVAMKSAPFFASRTAAVASTSNGLAPIACATA